MSRAPKKEHRAMVLTRHIDDCAATAAAERGDWNTPWAVACGKSVYRDRDGKGPRRGLLGTHTFYEIPCNDARCPARLLVHSRVFEDAIEREVPTPEPDRAEP